MTKNINKELETGRSMVEMLGVLAVVGVLSVGSIAGYTYAMNKYYANELLAGASERAVLVAAQLVAGREPSLKEFAKHTTAGGTFATDDERIRVYTDGIGIEVSGVKGAVCKNLIKDTEDTDIIIVDTNDAELSEEDCDEDNSNTLIFTFGIGIGAGETIDPACVDIECKNGLTCFHGECKCLNGVFMCGDQCCAEGTYCARDGSDNTKYACAKPTTGCTKNSDCKDAEGNMDTSKYCKFSGGSCTNPGTGTCTDKGELDDTNDFTLKTLNLPKGTLTVYNSSGTMNWWSASNLCQAHGKQLVTMSDLGVSDNGQNYCYFDSAKRVNASKDETYQCNCIGDSGCTTTTTELYNKTSGYLWLADNYKENSCNARTVYIPTGFVGARNRHVDTYALCQ